MITDRKSLISASRLLAIGAVAALGAAGCGGSSNSGTATSSTQSANQSASGGTGVASAAQEAKSAATGDIPDSQVFLTFHDGPAGYSIRYPEGWAQKGSGNDVTIQQKQNTIHIQVSNGPAPSIAQAQADLNSQKSSHPTLRVQGTQKLSINGATVIKVSYIELGPADPVTGKRLQINTDRYEYAKGAKRAIVDLSSPQGVDNVDAYRMISQSFRWQ